MLRGTTGLSYAALLVGLGLTLLTVIWLSGSLTYGMRVARLTKVKTELLNVAQAEMEKLRGVPFDLLRGYPLTGTGMTGEVRVEPLTARRKRVAVLLQQQAGHQRVELVTY